MKENGYDDGYVDKPQSTKKRKVTTSSPAEIESKREMHRKCESVSPRVI